MVIRVLPADGYGTDGPLGDIVVHFELPVIEETGERGPSLRAVANGLGQRAI